MAEPSSIVFAIRDGGTLSDADAYVAELESSQGRSASAFAFRVDAQFPDRASQSSERPFRESLLRRAQGKPVFLVAYNSQKNQHELFQIEFGAITKVENDFVLREIQQSELHRILLTAGSRCLLKAGNGFHFVTPALVHCTYFLRIGDAVRSVAALEALSFWLRPHLVDRDAVLCDTWSIATIALGALRDISSKSPFDCLPGHPKQARDRVLYMLEDFTHRIPSGSRVVLVNSIASSGSLTDFLSKEFKSIGDGSYSLSTVSLYGFANSPTHAPILCRLPQEVENYASPEDCPLCNAGDRRIRVDPELYYIQAREETPVILPAGRFQSAKSFWNNYASREGVLRLHRDDPQDRRHHCFDIDVATLCDDARFVEAYLNVLSQLPVKPDLVVFPEHRAGIWLGVVAATKFNIPCIISSDLRRGNTGAADQSRVENARTILFVDDVVNSGARLDQYNCALREDYRGVPFQNVFFVVGVARPESEAALAAIRTRLTLNHTWRAGLLAVECVFLPRWGVEQCPWCFELKFLSGIINQLSTPPQFLGDRVLELARSERGLTGEPLFLLPGTQTKALGQASVAADANLSSIGTIFAVTSALQSLRNDPDHKKRLTSEFPMANVFAVKNLLNYSEGLLRASFLRVITADEWGSKSAECLRNHLTAWCKQPQQDSIVGECLLAMARRTIDPFLKQDLVNIFEPKLGQDSFTRVFDRARIEI